MSARRLAGRLLAALLPAARPRARRRSALEAAEQETRVLLGVPARHPEWVTRGLPGADEDWLAAVAAQLWPGDEYLDCEGEDP